MTALHIQLLGDFHLSEGGVAVTGLETARLQAFFCFLLIHAFKPQTRHYIASVLWPDSSETQARTNLRKYIHQLRYKLPVMPELFDVGHNTIQWRASAPAMVDVHQFEQYVEQARQYQKQICQEEAITALEQAVGLYGGDLLPACYEDWIALPRERLASQHMQALTQLAHLLQGQGQYHQAIPYAQKLLERDNLCEASYRRLMHLHLLTGNRAKALDVYEQCVAVLRREMDIEPGPVSRALYQQVKTSQPNFIDELRQETAPIASHLKQMTMMWVDIAGFGSLPEIHEPQLIFADLTVYMNLLGRLIQAEQGQVIKRMGDAILAMYAQADEALQTAYTIQNTLRDFNQDQQGQGRPSFPSRISLATGEVLMAQLNTAGVPEVEIMGKCVNVAVRLQHVTPVDGISLDQLSYVQNKRLIRTQVSETTLTHKDEQERVYIIDLKNSS